MSVERSPLERAAAAARRSQIDAQPAGRAEPVGRQQHRHAVLLELRHRFAEEEPDGVRLQMRLGALGEVEHDAAFGEQGLDHGHLPRQRPARVARAQERENAVPALPQERRGEAQGRIVGCLEPQLERERLVGSLVIRGSGRGSLVEAQSEEPRRRGAALEPLVDPPGEPALEGGVAGVGG